MDCTTLASQIFEFLGGQLSEADQASALEHLASCESCEAILADTRSEVDLVENPERTPLTNDDRSRMLSNVIDEIDK